MKRAVAIILAVVVLLAICFSVNSIKQKKANEVAIQSYVNQVKDTLVHYSGFTIEYEVVSELRGASDYPYCKLTFNVSGETDPNYGDLFTLIEEVQSISGYSYGVSSYVDFYYNGNECYLWDGYRLRIDGEEVYNAIAAKNGVNLTTAEKKAVCEWIFGKYDYYDNKEGGYTGDKYSDKIFADASEYFNIGAQDLDIIWMNYYSY